MDFEARIFKCGAGDRTIDLGGAFDELSAKVDKLDYGTGKTKAREGIHEVSQACRFIDEMRRDVKIAREKVLG